MVAKKSEKADAAEVTKYKTINTAVTTAKRTLVHLLVISFRSNYTMSDALSKYCALKSQVLSGESR